MAPRARAQCVDPGEPPCRRRLVWEGSTAAYHSAPNCWVCMDEAGPAAGQLLRGCACRGSGGHAHIRCLIICAEHRPENWTHCPTCKQDYTGVVALELARAAVQHSNHACGEIARHPHLDACLRSCAAFCDSQSKLDASSRFPTCCSRLQPNRVLHDIVAVELHRPEEQPCSGPGRDGGAHGGADSV